MPTYPKYNDIIISKSIGDAWMDSCSAEGWPLPKLTWYFNNKLIQNQNESSPFTVIHHRNITTTSIIQIKNITKSSIGRYSCYLNGVIPIKNVTLILNSGSGNNTNKSGRF